MSVAKAMQYEATPVRPSKKRDSRIISDMNTLGILWFVVKKHKTGLLITTTIVGFTYDNLLPFVAHELFTLLFRAG